MKGLVLTIAMALTVGPAYADLGHEAGGNGDTLTEHFSILGHRLLDDFRKREQETGKPSIPGCTLAEFEASLKAQLVRVNADNLDFLKNKYGGDYKDIRVIFLDDQGKHRPLVFVNEGLLTSLYNADEPDYSIVTHAYLLAAGKNDKDYVISAKLSYPRFSQFDSAGFQVVCRRSRPTRQLLELVLGMPCDRIDAGDLNRITELDYTDIEPGPLKPGDFSGLKNLETLKIEQFGMTNIPKGLFVFLPKLKSLYLSGNKLKRITSGQIGSTLQSLQSLVLENNELESIELGGHFIGNCAVFLGGNRIHSLKDIKISWLWIELLLENNPIEDFDMSGTKWLNVLRLEIGGADLKTFTCDSPGLYQLSIFSSSVSELSKKQFSGCPALFNVYVFGKGSTLSRVDADTFSSLNDLTEVWIKDTRIRNLPPGLFSRNRQLQKIDLSGNDLSDDLNDILPTRQFTELVFNHNHFVHLPEWFGRLEFGGDKYLLLNMTENPLSHEARTWLKQKFGDLVLIGPN